MKKIPTFAIVNIIFWSIFILLNIYFKSAKSKYLTDDINAFKNDSWKYSLIISLLLLIAIAFYFFKILNKKVEIRLVFLVILSAFLIPYFLQSSIDNFLLYMNTKFTHEVTEVKYDVVENKENNVYHLSDGKDFISQKKELDKMNSHVVNRKYPSIYDYKNKDVVTVQFNSGLLNVKYLE